MYLDGSLGTVDVTLNLLVGNTAEGLGTGDTGAGGSIHIGFIGGSITNNTIVNGAVPNEVACGGGGISLESTPPTLDISFNIIALNEDCGISCRSAIQNTLGSNLFWANAGQDLGSGSEACPSEWSSNQIFADPLFCGASIGNYTVSKDSPALTGPVPLGVWTTPGCGTGVAVRSSTWGRLKALYH